MEFIWKIAVKKAISRAIQAFISILASTKVSSFLTSIGVGINIDPTLLAASLYGAIEYLRNLLKIKYGVKFL